MRDVFLASLRNLPTMAIMHSCQSINLQSRHLYEIDESAGFCNSLVERGMCVAENLDLVALEFEAFAACRLEACCDAEGI